MSLDTPTLYIVATMIAAMLGAMLLLFGKQENIPALKWWGTAYLLGAASVALWTFASGSLGAALFYRSNALLARLGGTGAAVTAVAHGAPRSVLEALFADGAVTHKSGARAKQAVIVQSLNHRYLSFEASPINRRRDHHEGVVDVHNVWFFAEQQISKFAACVAGPDGVLS